MSSRSKLALATLLVAAVAVPAAVLSQGQDSQRVVISARYPAVQWVDTRTLASWLVDTEGGRPVLLDARELAEFRVSHLEGARQIDPDVVDLSSLGLPRDARIVVYCSIGWRSGGVADRMRLAGYEHVYNLEGGIFHWANEGRAMRSGDGAAQRVHPYDAVWGQMLDDERRAPLP